MDPYTRVSNINCVPKIIARIWRAMNGGSRATDLIWDDLHDVFSPTKVWPFVKFRSLLYSFRNLNMLLLDVSAKCDNKMFVQLLIPVLIMGFRIYMHLSSFLFSNRKFRIYYYSLLYVFFSTLWEWIACCVS